MYRSYTASSTNFKRADYTADSVWGKLTVLISVENAKEHVRWRPFVNEKRSLKTSKTSMFIRAIAMIPFLSSNKFALSLVRFVADSEFYDFSIFFCISIPFDLWSSPIYGGQASEAPAKPLLTPYENLFRKRQLLCWLDGTRHRAGYYPLDSSRQCSNIAGMPSSFLLLIFYCYLSKKFFESILLFYSISLSISVPRSVLHRWCSFLISNNWIACLVRNLFCMPHSGTSLLNSISMNFIEHQPLDSIQKISTD